MEKDRQVIQKVRENVKKVIIGKDEIIDLLLTALLSSGHVLLEDVPGVGKTTIAKALARTIDCEFKRIQFTPDLLPADLMGVNFYNQKIGDFEFRQGPLFTHILLADEINRATPRTQSSLLECMEERQVTVDGETHILEEPFFVIATQNPIETYGTFPLPEAQLDRFLLKIKMGYPQKDEEYQVLELFTKGEKPLQEIQAVCSQKDILEMQRDISSVFVDHEIRLFLLNIIEATRENESIELGASPRATIALYKASQALAYIKGRSYVKPDDIIYLAPFVLSHRIILKGTSKYKKIVGETVIQQILKQVPVPLEKI